MSDSLQINLNSKFATKYINGSKSNCVFNIPQIIIPSQHHIHISVINAIIPYSFFNINGSNNLLYYIINGVPNTLLVKPGNYNSNQLTTYLNQSMPGMNISYNSIYNKFTFKNNNETEFVLASFSTLLILMGFDNGIDDFVSSNYEITSNYCSNLNTNNHCIHIKSNFITENINSNNYIEKNTLTTIPINSPPNSLIVYNSMQKNVVNLYANLNDIQIKLVNQDDILLDLNGLDWSITLQLDIVDFVN